MVNIKPMNWNRFLLLADVKCTLVFNYICALMTGNYSKKFTF